ncbi:MAG: fused MFS/spermidine synthase [Deltaproteobacteria bacterium]|nr:MAG: fused MFS/spermidine synthase [Deltaproteobacteria bacterium]
MLLFALFFGSGVCALVYEVVWIRLLSLTLSVTVYALATVLCAFMAGLGLGAAIAARIVDRLERPLVAFGVAELVIAASGLVVPAILYRLGPAYVWIHDLFGGSGVLFVAGRFLLAFLVLVVPATFMGMTLIFLSRVVIDRPELVGRGAGALYAINTVGAVVGCVIAGFVLVPELGLRLTSAGAASLNLAIGLLAIATGWRRTARVRAPAAEPIPEAPASSTAYLAAGAYALSGFTAMGYELLWTRALEPYAHNSTYAYTAMLAMFLLGLGIGSAIAAGPADRLRRPLFALGVVEIGIGATVVGALILYGTFEWLVPATARAMGGLTSWPRVIALIFSQATVTLFATTLLFGATFPIVARGVVESIQRVGSRIGVAYTLNTLGSIAGALAVGFWVLPALGVRNTFFLLIITNVMLGAALVLAAAPRRAGIAAAVASALLVALAFQLVPPRLFEGKFIERFGTVVYYREEVTDTVMVTEDERGGRVIRYGDGRGTAGTITYVEDRMYAHLPMLLHPDPRSVLQIGYGVGNTLSAVAQHPVERIDCVELSPGVIEASPFFETTNRDVLADPRVRLVINDGRNFLMAAKDRYDVIRLDPPELHTRGVVNLYTREFYEMARDHLADGGIFSIWVNIAMTPMDDLRMLVRTIADVFPHVSVWHTPQFYSWVINGSLVPRPPDLKLIAQRFGQPMIRADLESMHIDDPIYFLKYFMFGGDEVAEFAGRGPLVTDDHTYLDFTVPRSKDSFYGIANMNTGNYLVQLMDPGARQDVASRVFLRKVAEALTFKQPVVPHVVNIEAAGFDRAEVSAGVAAPFEPIRP